MTLRVTIEEIPLGIEEKKTVIFTINIHNVSRRRRFNTSNGFHLYEFTYDTKRFLVPHMRDEGALKLVSLVLTAMMESTARKSAINAESEVDKIENPDRLA